MARQKVKDDFFQKVAEPRKKEEVKEPAGFKAQVRQFRKELGSERNWLGQYFSRKQLGCKRGKVGLCRDPRLCYLCGKQGHISTNCVKDKKRG